MGEMEYYVGLDMGTNSVGWAVTDTDYRLLRAKGKDMWGIREFDEALSSADRRTQRVSRRRLEREKVRIGLLKMYFDDEIKKVDPLFFVRMDNSKYYPEDKDDRLKSVNGIFDDKDYKDKDYYEQYPTIFHLRKELIRNEISDVHDVRLVYLAIHNMFKHRGHFLDSSISVEMSNRSSDDIFADFRSSLSENYDIIVPEGVTGDNVIGILKSRDYSRSAKADQLLSLLGLDKKKKEIVKMVCGLSVKVKSLFPEIELDEDISFSFTDSDYDEKREKMITCLSDEMMIVIDNSAELYNKGALAEILGEYTYLSEARVASYEEHKSDLKMLKDVFRKYGDEAGTDYDEMFRSGEKGSYSAYVNSLNYKSKVYRRNMSERTREDFYKKVKSFLKKWSVNENSGDECITVILDKISKEQFMPKQLTASNGVISNQVHARELRVILNNAEKYLPFLEKKDEKGLTVSERILKLFSFQVPYYVGPTSKKSEEMGGNGWVVRKESGQVLPWNIEEKIDLPETRKKFIENLIRNCTYLSDEKVLPKASIIYEKFCVLNEINNIRVDEERLDPSVKQRLFSELYMSGKRVTRKKIVGWLKNNGLLTDEGQVSGIDININNQLTSYNRFYGVFGEDMKKDEYLQMAEDISRIGTVYGDAKDILKEEISKKYGDRINENQLKRILGWKLKNWTRLSKAFLELEGVDKSTGEMISVINALWETNLNMMELLHSKEYTFEEELEKRQEKSLKVLSDFTADDLKDMYFSAPVRRMIWQTILVLREIEQILGCPPTRVFIEMTRQPDDKKERKDSRKKQLMDLYASIKGEEKDWASDVTENLRNTDDAKLRSKKLYLYYTQMGRDIYTGECIDLDDLFNRNLYDIDHIYPQHFVKDDNINNNMVLVNKQANNRKQDEYPIGNNIRTNTKVRELWDVLHRNKLINDEKYRRLTRNTGFSEDEQASFIARQLVETSQGTKGVADLLKSLYDPDKTKIVYAKARNVSDFRNGNNGTGSDVNPIRFPKSRLINDFHHANDAYLNIVVGNAYYVKFTQDPINFIKGEYAKDRRKNGYHLTKMFDRDIKRGDEVAWVAKTDSNEGTIATVKKIMSKNTPLLTRLSYEKSGAIAKIQPVSAKIAKADVYIPVKTGMDVEKYGGFDKPSRAYLFLVEHKKGNKMIRSLETVPVYREEELCTKSALYEYCLNELHYNNPVVRLVKIKMFSLLRVNGYDVYITGVGGNQIALANAVNMILDKECVIYIKKIENYLVDNRFDEQSITHEMNCKIFDELVEKHCSSIFSRKPNPIGEKLLQKADYFYNLSVEKQCGVLFNILSLSSIGGRVTDLSGINESKQAGKLMIGKNISNCEEAVLINRSVTGLFENYIDLLKI